MYGDFMDAFATYFASYMGTTIPEIQIGLGPSGELRYPGYPLSKWQFCGIGAFQSYGSYAAKSLSDYIHSSTDGGSPSYSGSYNNKPMDVCFFQNGCANSEYSTSGQQYLKWYTSSLVTHGGNVMALAQNAFKQFSGVTTAGKVSGIHWWVGDSSRAAEATSGYNMVVGANAYSDIARMFKNHNSGVVFTCFEMRDNEQPASCASKPEELVKSVRDSAYSNSINFSAENALPRYDQTAYDTIVSQSSQQGKVSRFTFLRLCDDLINQLSGFANFVSRMNAIGGNSSPDEFLYETTTSKFSNGDGSTQANDNGGSDNSNSNADKTAVISTPLVAIVSIFGLVCTVIGLNYLLKEYPCPFIKMGAV